jgi:hypothetical protein
MTVLLITAVTLVPAGKLHFAAVVQLPDAAERDISGSGCTAVAERSLPAMTPRTQARAATASRAPMASHAAFRRGAPGGADGGASPDGARWRKLRLETQRRAKPANAATAAPINQRLPGRLPPASRRYKNPALSYTKLVSKS